MKSNMAVSELNNIISMRGDVAGCVVNSDRESQFLSRKFLRALPLDRLIGPIYRVVTDGDSAALESFFVLLQKEHLHPPLRNAPLAALHPNRAPDRAHLSSLPLQPDLSGHLTQAEFEVIMNASAALAAWLHTVLCPCSKPNFHRLLC